MNPEEGGDTGPQGMRGVRPCGASCVFVAMQSLDSDEGREAECVGRCSHGNRDYTGQKEEQCEIGTEGSRAGEEGLGTGKGNKGLATYDSLQEISFSSGVFWPRVSI